MTHHASPPHHLTFASKPQLLALAAVFLVGLLHLPHPLGGDQALFLVGAQKLRHGALLYRDFWDVKQPAIFLFYLVGGTLFGFHEVGIHAFELLYLMAMAVVLQATLRSYFQNPAIGALAPLLTVGI